jgi:diguanylate cyclase (GGDEF)-like protein
MVLLWISATSMMVAAQLHAQALPTLTTIRAVHTLSLKEAVRAYPVDLIGVITYYDPFLNYPGRPLMMVTDATGSIYVGLQGMTTLPLKAGLLVEVKGQSNPGDFAPIIDQAQIRILGQTTLPKHAPRESLTHLVTGSFDAQWVEMEGVIESVQESGKNVTLKLAVSDGEVAATAVKEPGVDYASLIDARVLIRCIAGSQFNRNRQIVGEQLLVPGIAMVKVEDPAPQHPFQMPVSPIRDVMRYSPGSVFVHRVHIRAAVTLYWPGRLLCIQDGSEALCAETAQTTPLNPGQMVDVIGFPQIGTVAPTLSNAAFQTVPGTMTASVSTIDAAQAFGGVHDAQLVQIDGRFIAHDKASPDTTLVMTSGKFTFPVTLPRSVDPKALLELEEGSTLRVTGICSVQADSRVFTRHDGFPVVKYFQILLRSPTDVIVLKRPSWWSAKHALRVLALALAMTMCVLCWVVYLRTRLKRQTELLRYQATHDGLTGLWNRKAVLDLLRREFEIAARANKKVGVIMLDADRFKHVNDTYGHLAGDAVLMELAKRIQQVVRSYDLTGRFGGEEFLIVLPECTGEEVQQCAERIRAVVAGDPISADGSELAMTVSLGTAVLDPLLNTQRDALATADNALYQAKLAGRNRVVAGHLQPQLERIAERYLS